MMKFCFLLTFLFLLLQTPWLAMADRQLINETCKTTPSYDLCLQILLEDPTSFYGGITDLAIIVVKAVANKSVQTLSEIHSLYGSHPEWKKPLNACTRKYRAIVMGDVPSALQALHGGVPKFAEDGMADSAIEAQSCERGFSDRGQQSPLTETNQVVQDIANVGRSIIRKLL